MDDLGTVLEIRFDLVGGLTGLKALLCAELGDRFLAAGPVKIDDQMDRNSEDGQDQSGQDSMS